MDFILNHLDWIVALVLRVPLLFYVVLAYVLLILICFTLYLAAMPLIQAKRAGTIPKPALILGYPIVLFGVLMDFVLNVAATLVFLDPPHEYLLTIRCNRYIDAYDDWRHRLALWICRNLLDPFEIGGHCHKSQA